MDSETIMGNYYESKTRIMLRVEMEDAANGR